MKIKLMLFLSDAVYAENLEIYFKKYFIDKVELYIYSNLNSLKSSIVSNRADVLILDEGTADVAESVGKSIQIVYLVSNLTGELPNEVMKYQKADNIYKALLNVCAEKKSDIYKGDSHSIPIYVFQSVNGGAGATTLALAYAKSLTFKQKRVFYLNLEELESTYMYMDTDGAYSMDDVLFALKSKRGSLEMKIESAVRLSKDGIYYFYPSTNPCDMKEITVEDIDTLLGTLASSNNYDIIIIDQHISIDQMEVQVMKQADKIFWISNGAEISAYKYQRAKSMMMEIERKNDIDIFRKVSLIYNGFSNKNGKEIIDSIDVIGGFPRYERTGFKEIVNNLSKSELFHKLDI